MLKLTEIFESLIREAFIDPEGRLQNVASPNQDAAVKLAFEELASAGVPVSEPRWHEGDESVLFMIDAEEDPEGIFLTAFSGSDRAKMEAWKNSKVSNIITDTLRKYRLWGEWEDAATYNIRHV